MTTYKQFLDTLPNLTEHEKTGILKRMYWWIKEQPLVIYNTKYKHKPKAKAKHIRIKTSKLHSKVHIDIFNEYWWEISCCQRCWWIDWWLQIHHVNKKHNDNHPLNLIKLCLICHTLAHKWDRIHRLMVKRLNLILSK